MLGCQLSLGLHFSRTNNRHNPMLNKLFNAVWLSMQLLPKFNSLTPPQGHIAFFIPGGIAIGLLHFLQKAVAFTVLGPRENVNHNSVLFLSIHKNVPSLRF